MIRSMAHVVVYVKNHEEAKEFYVQKLGLEVKTDMTIDSFRWLTVGTTEQPELEIALMELTPGGPIKEEHIPMFEKIMQEGGMGAGVFRTDDCNATYAELKAKGVNFLSKPEERPYGIEATFADNSGNWFSLVQSPQP